MGWLTEPFVFGFMQRALVASVIVGVVCAVIGCYIVLRSMAFLGDALAHAILPGVAVAYLVGANLLAGALAAGVIVAVGISFVTKAGTIREDTAIGIFFAAALALGVVLISTTGGYAVDLTHVLFGNVLGVSATDLWISGGLALSCCWPIVLLLPAAAGGLVRPCLRPDSGSADPCAPHRAVPDAGGDHSRVAAHRGRGPGRRHAGHSSGGGISADPPAARHDGRLSSDRGGVGGGRALPQLLPRRGVRGAVVLVATAIFVLAFLFAPRKGVVWGVRRPRRVRPS